MSESSNVAAQTNEALKAIIQRVKIDTSYTYTTDTLLDQKVRFLADHCMRVLDVGKSSRHRYQFFTAGQVVTTDINQFDNYPDIVDDICNIQSIPFDSFDGVICMAVLEHVYDPANAVKNLFAILKPGGYLLAYVPFLYPYHAPKALVYQDFYRYTRDGIAYLFRDFGDVTLYPCRGRYSTILNLLGGWKAQIEQRFGQRLNRWIDRMGSFLRSSESGPLQASGYYIWAIKQ
jgi:SAM-dependent methyltransferase